MGYKEIEMKTDKYCKQCKKQTFPKHEDNCICKELDVFIDYSKRFCLFFNYNNTFFSYMFLTYDNMTTITKL